MNVRGVCLFWCSFVWLWISGRCNAVDLVGLGIDYCMGDSRTVSCGPCCCKTFPRIARTINKMDSQGYFYGASKNSHFLLRKVRLWFQFDCLWCSTSTSNLVLLLFLPFSSPNSRRRSRYANLWWYLHLTNPYHFNRPRLHWQMRSLWALRVRVPKSCRYSYWDHASSLEFESIMPTSSPTPTKELAWLRSPFRSAYTFQLAMVCNQNTFAVITLRCSWKRIFWSSFVLVFLESFVVILLWSFVSPWYVARASLWYLEFHYVFRGRIFRLCFCILFWRPSHWYLTLIMIR